MEIGGLWNAEVEYLGHWGAYVDVALASAVFAVFLLIEWRAIAGTRRYMTGDFYRYQKSQENRLMAQEGVIYCCAAISLMA